MLKKDIIVRIIFSDTETTLLQKQQQNVIQPLSYKKLSTSNGEIFRFLPHSEKMVNFQQGGLLDVVTE